MQQQTLEFRIAQFGWNNIDVFKLGLQWQASPSIAWRFGVSHADQPIDSDQVLFNILATAVVEDYITAGFTYKTNNMGEINLEAMHTFHHGIHVIIIEPFFNHIYMCFTHGLT